MKTIHVPMLMGSMFFSSCGVRRWCVSTHRFRQINYKPVNWTDG